MNRVLLIAGPTAAGKTALAIEASKRIDGEIINADSMQVYGGLTLITARPSEQELMQAKHHLFGTIDPGERFSVGQWLSAAMALIEEVEARGKTAILVGGTGLYFNALTKGLAPVPDITPAARARAEALIEAQGLDGLRSEALRLDPQGAARIEPADRQRLQRIVEVGYATGEALSRFHAETEPILSAGRWTGLVIEPDREALYARINLRFDRMMETGALDEVRRFMERQLDPSLPAMKALGVPPLIAHLRDELPLDEAIDLAKRDSRRYAKRQMTWFRNQHADWGRITSLEPDQRSAELDAMLGGFKD
ncbi:tRNA (adenosine(37)-N6)-dimethylallyltransferase MiaA [Maricaulis sp.]|uniref:tRNA (adenosine(37)-N6)-dimethylallyltransferase MiaA n=1 Tax=Maricaulis sp. TaxID=1486257 RepID=UPI002613CA5E|nr:tRNA (adenosine(37)-N6)-dimethylallyltransferase MiaA [Maricaulis sp.]